LFTYKELGMGLFLLSTYIFVRLEFLWSVTESIKKVKKVRYIFKHGFGLIKSIPQFIFALSFINILLFIGRLYGAFLVS